MQSESCPNVRQRTDAPHRSGDSVAQIAEEQHVGRKRVVQRDWRRVLKALEALVRDTESVTVPSAPPALKSSAAKPDPDSRRREQGEGFLPGTRSPATRDCTPRSTRIH